MSDTTKQSPAPCGFCLAAATPHEVSCVSEVDHMGDRFFYCWCNSCCAHGPSRGTPAEAKKDWSSVMKAAAALAEQHEERLRTVEAERDRLREAAQLMVDSYEGASGLMFGDNKVLMRRVYESCRTALATAALFPPLRSATDATSPTKCMWCGRPESEHAEPSQMVVGPTQKPGLGRMCPVPDVTSQYFCPAPLRSEPTTEAAKPSFDALAARLRRDYPDGKLLTIGIAGEYKLIVYWSKMPTQTVSLRRWNRYQVDHKHMGQPRACDAPLRSVPIVGTADARGTPTTETP